MRLNKLIQLRISTDMDNMLNELSRQLGSKKGHLIRMLLTRAIRDLKKDIREAGGIENLIFIAK